MSLEEVFITKNLKNLSTPEIKETEKDLELEKSLFRLNKCYDYDDTVYRGIRDIGNLFDEIDEDNYISIKKNKSALNGNYIEYQSKGDKDKNLCPKEYLDMIRPYLSDMIIDYKTQGERKIQ